MDDKDLWVQSPSGKELSCGVIIQNSKNEILGCHSNGKRWVRSTWDLPKGHLDEGETPKECAIRECKEETSWDISEFKDLMQDLGVFEYTLYKDLHLFYLPTEIPDIKLLKCQSFFKSDDGNERPEVNGFGLIKSTELNYFFSSLEAVLKQITEIRGK